jgi:poly-gamma-glutamate synthesis protein (capsule biosynthesis protein)
MEWANLPKANMPARPGINPLRVHTRYRVTSEVAATLKHMAQELDVLRKKSSTIAGIGMDEEEFAISMPGEQSQRSGGVFCVGDTFGIEMKCNSFDLEGNIRSINEARKMADLVMVAHHFNISEGNRGDVPTAFAREFAHAAIDAGADMYFGHGWHKTLGIEIYKGKPIFYGLGNVFAQSQFLRKVPYDGYETWGHDMNKLPTLNPADEPLHPGLDRPSDTWWSSAVIEVEFKPDGSLKSLTLIPVELGRDVSSTEVLINRRTGGGETQHCEGRPMVATGQNAKLILERFQKLSKLYGTEITIDGEVGRWNA